MANIEGVISNAGCGGVAWEVVTADMLLGIVSVGVLVVVVVILLFVVFFKFEFDIFIGFFFSVFNHFVYFTLLIAL